MAILNDPDRYYGPAQGDWSLGDVVIVPMATLWAAEQLTAQRYPQPAPPPDGSRAVVYELWQGDNRFPGPLLEGCLSPGMIVLDNCVLDKEFNAFVEQRINKGMTVSEAEAEGRRQPNLDPLVLIAPIRQYRALRFASVASVRQGQSTGYFSVVGSPEMDEGYVDFTRTLPVSRRLLRGPYAALSEPSRHILRWKLAQFYAARNLSVDAEIAAAIGKTITAVHAITDTKQLLVVDLELDHGSNHLRLRQEPRRTDVSAGHQRGRGN